MKKNILVTGAAGFIGFHFCNEILKNKRFNVFGIDNLNNYYSVKLKKDRLKILKQKKNFNFSKIDISNFQQLKKFFLKKNIDIIFNLAAQAGVRYSLIDPNSYIKSNLKGFLNILEFAKIKKAKLIYASSSSVYGEQKKFPVKENYSGEQKNLYASTKKLNEELSKIYNENFNVSVMGLRFFTVYGEWGRPDMLYLKYLDALRKNKKIYLYNFGNHTRDFTYVGDVVDILIKLVDLKGNRYFQNSIYNICSNKPVNLTDFLKCIEKFYGKKCKIEKIPKQQIEILKTHGSNIKITKLIKKNKFFDYKKGLANTVDWYKKYYLK